MFKRSSTLKTDSEYRDKVEPLPDGILNELEEDLEQDEKLSFMNESLPLPEFREAIEQHSTPNERQRQKTIDMISEKPSEKRSSFKNNR